MKKILLAVASLLVLFLLLLLLAPCFFRGQIARLVERHAAARLEGTLDIGEMRLSMFRSFPRLNVVLEGVTLADEVGGRQDTLAFFPFVEASVDMLSLLGGDRVVVHGMLVRDGRLTPTVSPEGTPNWHLFPVGRGKDAGEEAPHGTGKPGKVLELNNVSFGNLSVAYNDYHTSTYASAGRVDLSLLGGFSATDALTQLSVALQDISYRRQNTVWVSNTDVEWQTVIAGNWWDKTFRVTKNNLRVNDLQLDLTGDVALLPEGCRVDLRLHAPDNRFENLLSLLPRHLLQGAVGVKGSKGMGGIEDLETAGDFRLDLVAEGEWREGHYPRFHADVVVEDASLKYPQLPEAVRNINLDLRVDHPGGAPDSMRIALQRAAFEIAGNPFALSLRVSNPVQPVLEGEVKGVIDFASLKRALPLREMTLRGVLSADVAFNGEYRYIEEQQYEKFVARGSIACRDLLLVNAAFPEGLSIPHADLTVTPAFLRLNRLQGKVFSSDFSLQGRVADYFPYLFKGGVLRGNFALTSSLLDFNDFILAQAHARRQDTAAVSRPAGTVDARAVEVPRNLDVRLDTRIGTVVFDRLQVDNVRGKVRLADAVATLDNLAMGMLGGILSLDGQYSTADPRRPSVDFALRASELDLRAAAGAFTFLRRSLPVAADCRGRVSADMTFAATLDDGMSPLMETASGKGSIASSGITFRNNPAMRQLGAVLKNEGLEDLEIGRFKIDFELQDGDIVVAPFTTSFAGNPITVSGRQSVDGKLDYNLSMTLDRAFFGKEINSLLRAIPGTDNIRHLDLDAHIGGTLEQPAIKPDLSKAVKTVTKELQKNLKGNLLQGLQGLFRKGGGA